jgi:cation diffusion facilitator family transporter
VNPGSRKTVLTACFANFGIAAAKLLGYLMTGAASLLAETIHSLADSGNQLLLLLGASRARLAPTAEHPFGYGRERYFWSFVVALVLFALGSLFAIYEGIHKLQHPEPISRPGWAIGILIAGACFEGYAFRTAIKEANPLRRGASWWSFVRHTKAPELAVVLLEDLGALVGLLLALVCIGLASYTGDPRFDGLGSVLIGILLGAIAILLAIEMQSLIIGEAASRHTQDAIRTGLTAHPRCRKLIHMRTQHVGPDTLLVGAKLELDPDLSFAEVAQVIDEIEADVRGRVSYDVMVYLEPDVQRPELAFPA